LHVERGAVDDIRYQLLHRTASALIEAQRFCAGQALMLVHSFSQTHEWFEDYARFAQLLGSEVRKPLVDYAAPRLIHPTTMAQGQPGCIHHVGERGGVALYLGWVTGEAVYLTR
jgi:hypothetical protein